MQLLEPIHTYTIIVIACHSLTKASTATCARCARGAVGIQLHQLATEVIEPCQGGTPGQDRQGGAGSDVIHLKRRPTGVFSARLGILLVFPALFDVFQ